MSAHVGSSKELQAFLNHLTATREVMAQEAMILDRQKRKKADQDKKKEIMKLLKGIDGEDRDKTTSAFARIGCLCEGEWYTGPVKFREDDVTEFMRSMPPARPIEIAEKVAKKYHLKDPYTVYPSVYLRIQEMVEIGQAVKIDVDLRCKLYKLVA